MRTRKTIKTGLIAAIFSGLFIPVACNSSLEPNIEAKSINKSLETVELNQFPIEALSSDEVKGVLFMREEEKLARDVYTVSYATWGRRIFNNISMSEQRHMDALKRLIEKYDLDDPVKIDSVGVFRNDTLQALYSTLTLQSEGSQQEALKVGALIEEIDILDLQEQLDKYVDNEDITFVYKNLMRGSHNHLRAFVRNLSRMGVEYEPQKLSAEQYQAIISSSSQRGRRGRN